MNSKTLNFFDFIKEKLKKGSNKKENDKVVIKGRSVLEDFRSRLNYSSLYTTEDLYTALDFPITIAYKDYLQKYKRQDVAKRIVKAPVQGTWADDPKVYETNDEDTQFELEWDSLASTLNIFKTLYKLDLIASLGRYAVLYLGLDDNVDPAIPVDAAKEVKYLTPIPEDRAVVKTTDVDPNSPRYGLPLTYQITIQPSSETSFTKTVHWSRLIHVAEDTLDNDIYGIPALEPVYNRLLGLDKLAGGSPEMYWRGARPGYIAQSNENTIITDEQLDKLKAQLSYFVNNMQRWMYVEGIDVAALSPQVVSPKDHVHVQLQLISAVTRIPMRILIGSERGELSSVQDERAWLTYLEERRASVAEDLILRPLIDRLISLGVLSEPQSGEYFVEWAPLVVLSEKERSEIAKNKAQALASYVNAIGATEIYPPEEFLKDLGKTESEIEKMLNVPEEEIKREDNEREGETKEEEIE